MFLKNNFPMILMYLMLDSCLMQVMSGHTKNFNELLKCNLSKQDIGALCNVEHEEKLYASALSNEANYSGISSLEEWNVLEYDDFPDIHPTHQLLLDTILMLGISSICDLGAGCGKLSKYLYANNPRLDITCVEHNSGHLAQMKENFEINTGIIKPNISVKAKIVKGCLPDLSFLPAESYDLVFTCTVMMHLPFIIAVKSAREIVRLSKKYILHVENKNDGTAWYNMAVVNPSAMSPLNCIGIDYVRLYESLGVKTLRYFEFKDVASPATYILYLGKKE